MRIWEGSEHAITAVDVGSSIVTVVGDVFSEVSSGDYWEIRDTKALKITTIAASGSGATKITTVTLNAAPTRDGSTGGSTALDDDLIGSLVELDITGYATSFIVDNDESSKTITVRGDWTSNLAVDDYVKVYPRESTLGNVWLGGGENGWHRDGGVVTDTP